MSISKTIEGYELPVAALAAALTHAAKDDVRYYLNGVYLDFPKGRIVATDGHRLFCGAIQVADCEPVIVKRDSVEQALKAAKKNKTIEAITVNVAEPLNSAERRRVELVTVGARFSEQEIDGRFPEYERVIPRKTDGTDAQYNVEYLYDARTALALYGERRKEMTFPHIARNGTSACLVTAHGMTALCVVMPIRSAGEGDDISEWFDGVPAQAEAGKAVE